MSKTRKLSLGMNNIIEVLKEEEKRTGKLPPKIILEYSAYSKVLKSDTNHILGGDKTQFFWEFSKGQEKANIVVRMYGSTYRISSVQTEKFSYVESDKYSPVTLVITG